MNGRRINEGLIYLRRSQSKNELSLSGQLSWAAPEAVRRKIAVDATQADLDYMIKNGLSSYKSLRIDDGISGSDQRRPGYQALLHDAVANPRVSHVLIHRRDRFSRPEDAMEMATVERRIRSEGVTFIFVNGVAEPLDQSRPDLGDDLKIIVEYYQGGEDLRKLAERVIDAHRILAADGFSTGGDAPYGFGRVLVNAAGNELMELVRGRRVREAGCHIRWKAKDFAKIAIWILILDLKHAGLGAKRIARRLNELGIPSPAAGRTRKDHGIVHAVSGKWCAGTVLELCRNAAILGLKEYGNRSEGTHRRLGADGHRTLTNADRNEMKRPKVIHNDPSLVVRKPTGQEPLFDPNKWNEIQRITSERGKNQRGIPRASDPGKYPLACRVVDQTDGCGSIMYGRVSGKRAVFNCGRYMKTAGAECENNSVDAEALLRVTLCSLTQQLTQLGQLGELQALLEQRAKSDNLSPAKSSVDQEIDLLNQKIVQLRADQEIKGRRMASEDNDARYQFIAAEFDRVTADLKSTEAELAKITPIAAPQVGAAEQVEAAMALISEILRVAEDPNARAEIRPILEKLRLWVGLDFTSAIKGKKRVVRRLAGGVIVFGDENLRVPIHGKDRIPDTEPSRSNLCEQRTTPERDVPHSRQQDRLGKTERPDDGDESPTSGRPERTKHPQESVSFTKVSRGDRI